MPEGPSIFILKEEAARFIGKKILDARGNAKFDKSILINQKIVNLKTWGKQFFIITSSATIRIHFLLFGSYSINENIKPEKSLRLHLHFRGGDIYFYTCAVKPIEDIDSKYDWEADVMSDIWNPGKARKKIKLKPASMLCDILLDQDIFSGSGNIMKNEILFRTRIHPETLVSNLPPRKLSQLIKDVRDYAFQFLEWKKAYVLKKNWLAHTKKMCKRCEIPLNKNYCGKTQRRTFYCENCQVKY